MKEGQSVKEGQVSTFNRKKTRELNILQVIINLFMCP